MGKVGWASREQGARLTLCASRLPLVERHEISLGFVRSNSVPPGMPAYGLANVTCSAGCGACSGLYRGMTPQRDCAAHNCSFDPRVPNKGNQGKISVTDFSVLRASPAEPSASAASGGDCGCELTVRNSQVASAVGFRVVVRALIVSPARHGVGRSFANVWHFNTNGDISYRRQLIERALPADFF
jgi:hypothetical protein